MLELTLKSNVFDDPDTSVFINGEKQKAVRGKGIVFHAETELECEILFVHSVQPSPYKYWIMYLLFLPLTFVRVIINAIFLNSLDNWYHSINPYSFTAKGKVYLNESKTIRFGYTEGVYNKTEGKWSKPRFSCFSPDVEKWEFNMEVCKISFYNEFFDYFCLMSMPGIIGTVFFGVMFYHAWIAGRLGLCQLVGGTMLFLLFFCVIKIVVEYKRMKRLLNDFVNEFNSSL